MKKILGCVIVILVLFIFIFSGVSEDKGGKEMISEMQFEALRLAGCDMDKFEPDNPRFTEQKLLDATAFLEKVLANKYKGTSFSLKGCVRRGLNQEYDEYYLIPDGDASKAFAARVFGSNGDFSCTDAYFGILKTDEFENQVKTLVDPIAPKAIVFSTIDQQFDEKYDSSYAIETAMYEDNFFAYSWILLQPDTGNFDEMTNAIEQTLRDKKLNGDYAVYLLTENGSTISSRTEAFERIPKNRNEYSAVKRFIIR